MFTLTCGFLTLWVLLYPFDFQPTPVTHWLERESLHKIDILSNVLLFMPWGFLGGWFGRAARGRPLRVVALVVLIGGLISLVGETLQVWLPGRQSSLVDLGGNTAGTALGAALGWVLFRRLTRQWNRAVEFLADRPHARRAGLALLVVLVARTAPFDFSPETFEVKQGWWKAAAHFQRTWGHRAVLTGPNAGPALAPLGWAEALRVAPNLLLFALLAVALGRALRESFLRRGDRTTPGGFVLFLGVPLVLGTELLQCPIQSRLMDITDAAAGLAGLVLGAGLEPVVRLLWPVRVSRPGGFHASADQIAVK